MLTVPDDIVVTAADASGVDVTYTATASSRRGYAYAVRCNYPVGTQGVGSPTVTANFPIGRTVVVCSSFTVSKSFVVTVEPPA